MDNFMEWSDKVSRLAGGVDHLPYSTFKKLHAENLPLAEAVEKIRQISIDRCVIDTNTF